jgi:exodeoxyribonuclease V beta subunit
VADDRRAVWQPEQRRPAQLSAAVFERALDSAWRRTSYTGLTSAVHDHAGVGSEPEVPERQDEAVLDQVPAAEEPADEDDRRLHAVPSPMADLPGGAAFGTLVHQVLERVDTAAEDLAGEVRARCDEAVAGRLAGPVDAAALAAALLPVFETPLGPLAGQLRLRDVAPADRLAELDFELPLAGGDEPQTRDGTLASIADLLARRLPPDGPVAGYADALRAPGLGTQRLRGYLAGSIDAVLRVRGDDGAPRYLVVDYKTNWLGDFTAAGPEPLTAWHYRPSALDDAMVRAHYPLQALLYSAALHRFLRWRQPDYDPGRHLGGILYLFTRGMCGPATPLVDGAPCGVFAWQPSAALVEDLSRLLEGGVA